MAKLLEQDWQFVRAGAEDLQHYLLSPELYWPLAGVSRGGSQERLLQFTLGNLELSQARLAAVRWPERDQTELNGLNEKIAAVHDRWKANWARKAEREQTARLKLWQAYLNDLLSETGRRASGYAFEVRLRAILHLLSDDTDGLEPAEQEVLSGLDARLRGKTETGPFVWEPEVQPGFPGELYWYLYVVVSQS